MRLLAFDFPSDVRVLDCKDEFMYGPSLLVCPVLEAGATSRQVYLPAGHTWIDFWSGDVCKGGTTMDAEAPLRHIPLYVKSGSIIPRYLSQEKHINPTAPMELCVYPGEDGSFRLYEDDGTTMGYLSGGFRSIPLTWDDTRRELTIGRVEGTKDAPRTFTVRLVGAGGGTKTVKYEGETLKVSFR